MNFKDTYYEKQMKIIFFQNENTDSENQEMEKE